MKSIARLIALATLTAAATPASAGVVYSLRHNNPAAFSFDFTAPSLLTERRVIAAGELDSCNPGASSPPFSSACVSVDVYATGGFSPGPADVLAFTTSTTGPLPMAPLDAPFTTLFNTGYLYFAVGAFRTLGTHANSFGTYTLTVAETAAEVPAPAAVWLFAGALLLVAGRRSTGGRSPD